MVLWLCNKGKGKKDDLENSRYIHLKDWLPRTCDSLLVDLMKERILASSSIFQIGGQEGHRTQEHLFTLRSIIARESYLGGGVVFQLYDIKKFFDKENLRDVMDTLHNCGVHPKLYRAWFKLNQHTTIKVNTAVGMSGSAEAGELIGQGSAGGALASQANIDHGLDRYFLGSGDEMHYGNVRLQPLAFQDDIARMARNVNEAVVGNIKMESMMKEKQLEVHPDKTGYIVLGSRTFKESGKNIIRNTNNVWKYCDPEQIHGEVPR